MFGGVDGKSTDDDEGGEHGEREPLVLRFLFEESSPTVSHGLTCVARIMNTLLASRCRISHAGDWFCVRRYHKGSIGRRDAWRQTYGT